MKKIIAVFIFLFVCLFSSAQINRTILGCTIGESTLSQVKQTLKSQGIKLKYEKNADAYIYISDNKFVSFGGVNWNGVGFYFKNDRLYQVQFQYLIGGENHLRERDFTRALENKYARYKQEVETPAGAHYTKFYRDNTKMVVAFTCYPGYCILQYFDDKVFDRIANENSDEL